CPWESTDMEQPPGKPRIGSTAPSKKSQSVESLKAEICPWEVQELESSDKVCPWEVQELESSDKAEICPWEGAEPQLEKGTAPGKDKHPPKEASKPWEKGSKDRESICPWESTGTEDFSLKTVMGKEPSRK
ncbi:GP179 protein, partial [Scytalopus superciliaris]|nr:GP179 protein [Scytalopus superciliaris]